MTAPPHYPTLRLRAGRDKPVRNKHPWVFSGAVARVEGDPAPGDIVRVSAADGTPLALGTYSPQSQIQARLISWDPEAQIGDAFWEARLAAALAQRKRLALEPETTAYRLVNAEADGLPGLVIDRYGPYVVVQCLTVGIDCRKALLAQLITKRLQPAGIWERSDVAVRRKEGLRETSGLLAGQAPPERLTVRENGLDFLVDLRRGHKTGHYLDQRDNRALMGQPRFVAGRDVLNVFAYTGGFAVYAARGGASSVISVDSSATFLELAEAAMAANGFARPQDSYLVGDAFQVLREFRDTGRQFDTIILDPPKFAQSKRDVEKAARGYKDLNWLAMRLLRPGGFLATFSCSGLVSSDLFQKILFGAALDARVEAQVLVTLGQAPDHPVLLTVPESGYLKGFLLGVDPSH